MLITFDELASKHDLDVAGILHIGAHEGQEYEAYRDTFGDVAIIWVEGDPKVFERLEDEMRHDIHVKCINAVVSDKPEVVEFHRANNEQSSSILPLGTHLVAHPEVSYVDSFTTRATTLDQLVDEHSLWDLNFVNMDVQGAEGKVIDGAQEYLKWVDYIYSEVNRDELYEGCTVLPEFDQKLGDHGFVRVQTMMLEGPGWGDAFYIRSEI